MRRRVGAAAVAARGEGPPGGRSRGLVGVPRLLRRDDGPRPRRRHARRDPSPTAGDHHHRVRRRPLQLPGRGRRSPTGRPARTGRAGSTRSSTRRSATCLPTRERRVISAGLSRFGEFVGRALRRVPAPPRRRVGRRGRPVLRQPHVPDRVQRRVRPAWCWSGPSPTMTASRVDGRRGVSAVALAIGPATRTGRVAEALQAAAEREGAEQEPAPADDEAGDHIGEPVHAEQRADAATATAISAATAAPIARPRRDQCRGTTTSATANHVAAAAAECPDGNDDPAVPTRWVTSGRSRPTSHFSPLLSERPRRRARLQEQRRRSSCGARR